MNRERRRRASRSCTLLGAIALAAGAPGLIALKRSEDTLTDRVAVDETIFNRPPTGFLLERPGGWLHLGGPGDEIHRLREHLRAAGFAPRAPGESSLDFALRAARFVQATLPFGPERTRLFRNWGFGRVLQEISRGQTFFCDTYSRLLVVIALAEMIPARSVWMDGHVTAEIYSQELAKWIMVDAMYNHYMVSDRLPLSVTEIRQHLDRGQSPTLVLLNNIGTGDEPSRAAVDAKIRSVYTGSAFKVFDGDINFESDRPHLILPAMSLATPGCPTGTSWTVRVMRIVLPLDLLTGLGAIVLGAVIGAGCQTQSRPTSPQLRS